MQKLLLIFAFFLAISAAKKLNCTSNKFQDIKSNEESSTAENCNTLLTEFWEYFSLNQKAVVHEVSALSKKDFPIIKKGVNHNLIILSSPICHKKPIARHGKIEKDCNQISTEFWKYFTNTFEKNPSAFMEEVSDICEGSTCAFCYEWKYKYPILCCGLGEKLIGLSSGICTNLTRENDNMLKLSYL